MPSDHEHLHNMGVFTPIGGEKAMGYACCVTASERREPSSLPAGSPTGRTVRLPSPPAVAIRILDAVRDEAASLEHIARILGSDPALAVKVLRVANSSLYLRDGKVQNIKKAVAVLGLNMLKNVALSFVIFEGIGKGSNRTKEIEAFWRRSICAAVTSEIISAVCKIKDDDLFISALLQDIGAIALRNDFPDLCELNLDDGDCGDSSLSVEKEMCGVDHAELGHEILRDWGLPQSICELVRFHHSWDAAPKDLGPKMRILDLSRMLSCIFFAESPSQNFETFSSSFQAFHGSGKQLVEEVINSAYGKTQEILSYFDVDPGRMKSCSQILQEANEELGKLNLTYEQIVLEHKTAKEKAEKLARELSAANIKLRELAYKDALTGLLNHGYFQELLEREIIRSTRYNRPLALILFDLDFFKRVNDQYGHPAGDEVLKRVSEQTLANVRKCDYVARYGGEEFAVILPETDAGGAAVLAERIRRAVERMEMNVQGTILSTTISCGVAACGTWDHGTSKSCLITAADKALYVSKAQGRNRISVTNIT